MPVLVACPSCSGKLRVPETAVGKRVRCPKCSHQFPFALPEEAEEAEEAVQEEEANGQLARRRAALNQHETDDDEEPEELEEVQEVPEAERSPMDQPKKKKKKKKRRRRELLGEKELEESPSWPWWVFGGSGMGVTMLTMLCLWIFGSGFVQMFGAMLFFSLPVGTVIFFASMFLASTLLGAVEIGQIHVTFVKAFFTVLIINSLTIVMITIPGFWYYKIGGTLALWTIVVMAVFRLDPWEATMVAVMCFILNWALFFLLIATLAGIANHAMKEKDGRGLDQRGRPAQQQPMGDRDDDDP